MPDDRTAPVLRPRTTARIGVFATLALLAAACPSEPAVAPAATTTPAVDPAASDPPTPGTPVPGTTTPGAPTSGTSATGTPTPGTSTPGASTGDAAAAAVDYTSPGPLRDLGAGVVTGMSPDGQAAYVLADDPANDELGCEGGPAQRTYLAPLDGGASRAASGAPLPGVPVPAPTGDRVAVVTQCEGFLTSITLADQAPDGTLSRPSELVLPTEEVELTPNSLSWTADGSALLGVRLTFVPERSGEQRDIVRVAVDTGDVTVLEPDSRAIAVADLGDGQLAVLTVDGQLRLGERAVPVNAFGFALAPDRDRVASFGDGGLVVVDRDGASQLVLDTPVFAATWAPSGDALAHAGQRGVDAGGVPQTVLGVTRLGAATTDVGTGVGVSAGAFTPDGRALAWTRFEAVPEGFTAPFAGVLRFDT